MNTLYFVKRSKKLGVIGVARMRKAEKKLAKSYTADGWREVSRETYLRARVAMVGF